MMRTDTRNRGPLNVAPEVTFTRLPFGGAVLVNGRTLDLIECDDRLADRIGALITPGHDEPPPDDGPIAELIRGGWLAPAGPEEER
jgi:hypothetical protein